MFNKIFLHIISSFFFVSFTVTGVYALEAPSDLRVTNASDSELYLDWSDVEGAVGYYLYYGTSSWKDSSYEVEWVNLIEDSEYILTDLQADTQYYVAVTAADESIVESDFSEEILYSTLSSWSETIATSLRIEEVNPIDETSIEMIFSKKLVTDSNAVREFILENSESRDEIYISLSEVDEENPYRLIALLDSELEENTEYELTVLDIQDESGGSIILWIDAFITFQTESFEGDVDMTSAGPESSEKSKDEEETVDEIIVEEDTEPTDTKNPEPNLEDDTVQEWNNAWQTISIENNTSITAENTEKLPQAGPEHWILVFLAFLLASGIYYKNRK